MSRLDVLAGRLVTIVTLKTADGIDVPVHLKLVKINYLPEIVVLIKERQDAEKENRQMDIGKYITIIHPILKEAIRNGEPDTSDAMIDEIIAMDFMELSGGLIQLLEKVFASMNKKDKKELEELKKNLSSTG